MKNKERIINSDVSYNSPIGPNSKKCNIHTYPKKNNNNNNFVFHGVDYWTETKNTKLGVEKYKNIVNTFSEPNW